MKQAKRGSPRIALDWSKLFGFDQIAAPYKLAAKQSFADRAFVKIGAKVGVVKPTASAT
jgi:hypothetical protein